MIEQVVANGCSYQESYVQGHGHTDLSQRFGCRSDSLTISGSANTRILRTTLKHSYETDYKTLYLIGLTFISREELPILRYDHKANPTSQDIWEGAWTNPQNQQFNKDRYNKGWDNTSLKQWIVFREAYEYHTLIDRVENLMYLMLAVIDSLTARGHSCIIYQQADEWWPGMTRQQTDRIRLLDNNKHIIGGFKWCAVREQHRAGVKYQSDVQYREGHDIDPEIRHRQPGEHKWLNDYLEDYIRQHELHL